jgi:hypothetical protein
VSTPITLESTVDVPLGKKLLARLTVAIARLMSGRSPLRLGRLLGLAQRGARPATAAQALRARQAVVSVSARCAGQQCLQRSIATALLCRLAGTWPEWRTGIRTEPFRAHAWVEVDGRAVGEAEDMSLYRVVLAIPA